MADYLKAWFVVISFAVAGALGRILCWRSFFGRSAMVQKPRRDAYPLQHSAKGRRAYETICFADTPIRSRPSWDFSLWSSHKERRCPL